ncbi:AMP-dependent synthetase [Nostocales cyanobacterium HT-58-2]|nr:AMP-dependent synthetase [Nostocales cyanobacterium HT-58-2]
MTRMTSYSDNSNFSTLVELLRCRALLQPKKKAFTFLRDGETEDANVTYYELDEQSRKIAAYLQFLNASNERALLLYPPGLEFIAAFFGCLYAKVVAVPAYPLRRNQKLSRLQAIVRDAQAAVVLTTQSELINIKNRFAEEPDLVSMQFIATDNITDDLALNWQEPTLCENTLAFLQYTSGSTGTPKGVMVSHGNLLKNSEDLDLGWEHISNSVMVTWLPTFHDMGLIYGVLQPLYKGFPCYLMPPLSFLQVPIRWLQAISRYKATHSGAPNFAYDLCVHKTTPEQRTTLNLSSWRMALNGAEPIKENVLMQFAEAFKPCGFDLAAFCPGYGLAEATLKVTAVRKKDVPFFYKVQAKALAQNQIVEATEYPLEHQQKVQTLVGCGRSEIDTKIKIVNPKLLTTCASNEVGEIWVSGLTVAQGYWWRTKETEQTFQAYLADTGEGPFLRTGDLGFLKDGELFVTGRLKDVIIIRGRNYYPQDIELTVEKSHTALRASCGAAFTVEVEGEERLVIAYEIERSYIRNLDVDEVAGAIRKAVSVEHELQVYAILLLKTASIPKTSSGKIQRYACRAGWISNNLSVIGSSILQPIENCVEDNTIIRETSLATAKTQRQVLLELDLHDQIAQILEIASTQLNLQQPLITFGLDSFKAVEIKHYIEANFGLVLPMEAFLEDINITQLATLILSEAILPSPTPSSTPVVTIQKITEFNSREKQQLPEDTARSQNCNQYQDNQVNITNTIDQENVEQLLTRLEQLSQQDVDFLLNQLLEVQEAGE